MLTENYQHILLSNRLITPGNNGGIWSNSEKNFPFFEKKPSLKESERFLFF